MPIDAAHYHARPVLLELGEGFYDEVEPARFPSHTIRFRGQPIEAELGLDTLDDEEWVAHFARFEPLPENLPRPLAMRYHGHQFRAYNPDLGDGRGFTFAQIASDHTGELLECGTKGSGTTPYSRRGDGRLTLKGGVREILAAEMLEALGVRTSRTLSLIETGESLERHDEPSPTRAGVLVRVGRSHIRFGSFQRHAATGHPERVESLLDHCVRHYAPSCKGASVPETAQRWFERVVSLSCDLCAQWMAAGFVHGVLNTDNMNINGESFDYGPWRFVPSFDPNFTAAYFDHSGLYRFGYQPAAVHWNLTRLAEALSVIAPIEALMGALDDFEEIFWRATCQHYTRRLGVVSKGHEEDSILLGALMDFMESTKAPFQQVFFDWYGGPASTARAASSPHATFYDAPEFAEVRRLLRRYEPREGVDLGHPYFADRRHPCDMVIEQMEALWEPIATRDDWGPLESAVDEIRQMGAALGASSDAVATE